MFKKSFAIAVLAIAASVQAAPVVTNSTGNIVYGSAQVLSVDKDTSAGYNRVKVKYASGYQFVNDDAAWSRHAKFVANLKAPVYASQTLVYDVAQGIVVCQNGNSVISWPNVAMPEIADTCTLFNGAKALSNQ